MGKAMEEYITIHSKRISAEALRTLLTPELSQAADIQLEVKRTRAVDPALLVAAVGAIGPCLVALITGLLNVAAQKRVEKIVLHGKSGRRIEVPAGTSRAALAEYIELARQLDVERIEL